MNRFIWQQKASFRNQIVQRLAWMGACKVPAAVLEAVGRFAQFAVLQMCKIYRILKAKRGNREIAYSVKKILERLGI
jgi:hypothetical protein